MVEKITVDGKEIAIKSVQEQDYISLTDMVRDRRNPSQAINNWIRNRDTIELLGIWERLHNEDFNLLEFEKIKSEAGRNAFTMSIKNWTAETNAIGIQSKAGRYGGTYAHRDIAFAFGAWVSPVFQFYLISEFQRLKSEEYQRARLEWDYSRFLSKVNYEIQTESIKNNLIPRLEVNDQVFVYATEADLLNLAVFGMTAKQWRAANPDTKGNIRDSASIAELTVLSNLESINAYFIQAGASKEARYLKLCEIVETQLSILKSRNDSHLLE